jgi:hypothetical protein
MIARALDVPAPSERTFDADDTVSREELATALAQAFNLTAAPLIAGPYKTATRGYAALALMAALEHRQ